MALDAANFIAELSITDPPGSDPLSQGDEQIRTIKRATFNSLPLLDKAVNITADQMNLMAIKNEANVFTAAQTIQNAQLILNAAVNGNIGIEYQLAGLLAWQLRQANLAGTNDWALLRYDVLGAFVDSPMTADWATGVVNFDHVPTIKGDPIWTAGEIKMLVQGASLPSNNWFVTNGTNGTVDLRDRIMGGQGVFFGTQTPFLDAQTTVGPVTGSHVLTSAQMPSHRHKLRELNSGGGIADGTALANTQSVAGIRNTTSIGFVDAGTVGNMVENTGGGTGHTHTIPEMEVETKALDAFQVMPFTYFMQIIQYVP